MKQQQKRVLMMLRTVPGLVTYEMLSTALDKGPTRTTHRRRLTYIVCRSRKTLAPGKSIENYENFGYQLIRAIEPRAA